MRIRKTLLFNRLILLVIIDFNFITNIASWTIHSKPCLVHTLTLLKNSNSDSSDESPRYRSIAEVVGGLHGGKYQFDGGLSIGYGSLDPSFSGQGSCNEFDTLIEDDENDIPSWVQRMQIPANSSTQDYKELLVPSNSNPMDGMVYSVSITIKNDERTWEKFYAKILCTEDESMVDNVDNVPFYVKPRNGYLAPRGGASNACDESKPYPDSATLRVFHNNNAETLLNNQQWWLVVGTEEEKWYYKLQLGE